MSNINLTYQTYQMSNSKHWDANILTVRPLFPSAFRPNLHGLEATNKIAFCTYGPEMKCRLQ